MESAGYLQDVDEFLDRTQVERAIPPAGRYAANAPFRVAGPLHQLVVENTMFL